MMRHRHAILSSALLLSGCSRAPLSLSAQVSAIDADGIEIEIRAPDGTQVRDDHVMTAPRPVVNGVLRTRLRWAWGSVSIGPRWCVHAKLGRFSDEVERCIQLPLPVEVMRRFPAAGGFAVLAVEQGPSAASLLVAAPRVAQLSVAGQPVPLDSLGVGRVNLDVRTAFFAEQRPMPRDWDTLRVSVMVDQQPRDEQIAINGTGFVFALIDGGPLPAAHRAEGLLWRHHDGQLERVSGATTLPRWMVSETETRERASSCYGRRRERVSRSLVVRDLRTGATVTQRVFAPRVPSGCPREYVIDLNDRRAYVYRAEDADVRAWVMGLSVPTA